MLAPRRREKGKPGRDQLFADHDEGTEGENDEASLPSDFAEPYTLEQCIAAAQAEVAGYFRLLYG